MILLDTTVLVYALGAEHFYREPCRELLDASAGGSLQVTTTVEVIQEFVHVRARRRGRSEAATLGRDLATLLSPLLEPDVGDLRDGLTLFEQRVELGAFDAVLAASAVNAGAHALVSADTAFADIPGLRHVAPDVDGVRSLLAS